ncbi:MAG TPA: hypothetical protein VES40_10920 [Ilumatobacteraceae bacterium]|nr:hypothetical protein [Ilumatobacteraceae bacterium]
MAFVNKASGEENQEATSTSGQPIDFDPFDPDLAKVHYDMSVWTFEQRAELSEALADAEFPHYWDGEELVVPEEVEAEVDALFERLEALFGPFPIILQDDAESTEFGLDEWSDADRKVLTEALIDAEIPHRWDRTTVIVAADAEHAVDDLLDAIESGELLGGSADEGAAPPEGALSIMFLAADKLAKNPLDAGARTTLIDMHPQLDPTHPPYGIAVRTWAAGVDGVGRLVALIDDHAQQVGTDEWFETDMIGAAQDLRALLRPLV